MPKATKLPTVLILLGAALGSPAFMRPNYTKGWYRTRPWEQKVYNALRVREGKDKMPTYSPEAFSPRLHGWEESAVNMCCSERVHEVSALLSFVPLGASLWFGAFWVFFCGLGAGGGLRPVLCGHTTL